LEATYNKKTSNHPNILISTERRLEVENYFLISFFAVLFNFQEFFDKRSFETFKILLEGWVLAPGRRTITNIAGNG